MPISLVRLLSLYLPPQELDTNLSKEPEGQRAGIDLASLFALPLRRPPLQTTPRQCAVTYRRQNESIDVGEELRKEREGHVCSSVLQTFHLTSAAAGRTHKLSIPLWSLPHSPPPLPTSTRDSTSDTHCSAHKCWVRQQEL